MKDEAEELKRLNQKISPYEGNWNGQATTKSERERMLRAQSRKRRQLRRHEADQHLWLIKLIFVVVAFATMLAVGLG
ncbi:hypothetical protein [Roseovarius sp. SYSU LYC5161]|uniref:hypothetical protein n=1 Tax=Roseovarius halophilus (ex Wu et al. 2025) TaxID=3376060 RepID=UPI00399BD333